MALDGAEWQKAIVLPKFGLVEFVVGCLPKS